MAAPKEYADELMERSVGLAFESGRPIARVARDLGVSPEALRERVRRAEVDAGEREGLGTDERGELKNLRGEVFELRRARADPAGAP
jgi:transposase